VEQAQQVGDRFGWVLGQPGDGLETGAWPRDGHVAGVSFNENNDSGLE
jgi:hypothetical protein